MQVLTICTFGKLYSFERKKNVVPGNEIKRIETEIRNPYFFQKKSAKEKKERMYWKRVKKKNGVGFLNKCPWGRFVLGVGLSLVYVCPWGGFVPGVGSSWGGFVPGVRLSRGVFVPGVGLSLG